MDIFNELTSHWEYVVGGITALLLVYWKGHNDGGNEAVKNLKWMEEKK